MSARRLSALACILVRTVWFDAAVSAELTTWLRRRSLAFAGAGVALATINQDVYGQVGFRSPTV